MIAFGHAGGTAGVQAGPVKQIESAAIGRMNLQESQEEWGWSEPRSRSPTGLNINNKGRGRLFNLH